ncbi:hypothetical protein PR048_018255 [Dryococelus australis]|uniref:HAT C-terminal dimerisation domain-containing protein n=1 Tax=Dryococelus australis TaxID=614101 RepID=A0ABQ9HBZ4_9NEOP|nr:hypothetical protein PR048_018255 [Dryococelus australis]
MLLCLYEVRKSTAADLANSDNNIDMLTQVELKQVVGIIEILGPLAEATNDISGDAYPSSSLVIPILHCLKTHLVNYITAKKYTITFAHSRDRSQISRFGLYESDDVYFPAMLCDPIFKSALLNTALVSLTLSKEVQSPNRYETEVSAMVMKPSTGFGLWSAFDQFPNEPSSKINEVENYLEEPRIPRDRNPYLWWKEEGKQKYPKLSKVAMKYLGIPATSVASERVFSYSGNVGQNVVNP